ncbi:hypothetical protein B0H10DRAFT_1941861 [Mycena sp. CBHHK59/15]|nr:hypothetical protein B0H10DRAFT_1941861 [Mycena sp. CBHHK59/15]
MSRYRLNPVGSGSQAFGRPGWTSKSPPGPQGFLHSTPRSTNQLKSPHTRVAHQFAYGFIIVSRFHQPINFVSGDITGIKFVSGSPAEERRGPGSIEVYMALIYTMVPGLLHHPVAELTDAIFRPAAVELKDKQRSNEWKMKTSKQAQARKTGTT